MRQWRWLLWGALLIVLAYAVRQVHWTVALSAIRRASIGLLLLAVVVNAASLGLRGIRWWIFLRALGIGSLGLSIRGVIVGCGLNNLLIANGGEAARTVMVSRAAGASSASVLATVALERLFDPLCFGLLVAWGSLTIQLPPSLAGVRWIGIIALLGTATFLVLLLLMRPCRQPAIPQPAWRSQLWILRERVTRLTTPRRFGVALLLSIGVWLLQLTEYAVVASALGSTLPFAASVAAMIAINAGLALRATPAGLGYFEFAYAVAVSQFGVATDVAVATALVIQMVEIVPVSVAALVIALRKTHARQRSSALRRPVFSGLSFEALGSR